MDKREILQLIFENECEQKYISKCIYVHLHDMCNDKEIILKEPIYINTWNRGYDFLVKRIYNREFDNHTMIGGTYFHNDNDEEFLDYIINFNDLVKLYRTIIE